MSLHQTQEPTPHPTQVRATAWDLMQREQGISLDFKQRERRAKEIETYLWGGFAPIEKAPTPLNTIEDHVQAIRQHLSDIIANHGDPQRALAIGDCSGTLERFAADISMLLSPPQS